MNSLIERKHIYELGYGTNFSYILNDNDEFLSTEYKVLQTQGNSFFVKCMKMLYNGKPQIFYLTDSMQSLSMLLPKLNADAFFHIVTNLFLSILDVKHNGFLSCQNIDISFDKIFIVESSKKVCLVYLPTKTRIFQDYMAFENELSTQIVAAIGSYPALQSWELLQLSDALNTGTLSIEELHLQMTNRTPTRNASFEKYEGDEKTEESTLHIVAINAPTSIEFEIKKEIFVIGKKVGFVDGVISFNPMISRLHCKIQKCRGVFTITDLKSANGTFVNGYRLKPDQPFQLNQGDVIRLANSDFRVSIK